MTDIQTHFRQIIDKKNLTPTSLEQFALNEVSYVDGKEGEHFEAHGITKGFLEQQLTSLLSYCEKGYEPMELLRRTPFTFQEKASERYPSRSTFFSANAHGCDKHGLAVIVAKYHEPIQKGTIQTVFINDLAKEIIPDLKEKFPQIHFYPLSMNKSVLTKRVQEQRLLLLRQQRNHTR